MHPTNNLTRFTAAYRLQANTSPEEILEDLVHWAKLNDCNVKVSGHAPYLTHTSTQFREQHDTLDGLLRTELENARQNGYSSVRFGNLNRDFESAFRKQHCYAENGKSDKLLVSNNNESVKIRGAEEFAKAYSRPREARNVLSACSNYHIFFILEESPNVENKRGKLLDKSMQNLIRRQGWCFDEVVKKMDDQWVGAETRREANETIRTAVETVPVLIERIREQVSGSAPAYYRRDNYSVGGESRLEV